MTRLQPDTPLVEFNPEIERTLRNLRQQARLHRELPVIADNVHLVAETMANFTRTSGEMVAPAYSYEPSDVVFSEAPMGLEIAPSSRYKDSSYVGYDVDYDNPYHRRARRTEELRSFPKWLRYKIARALPRYITELSDQEWDAIVWNCNSIPPPTYHFQPSSPPYPIQEPSPCQSYYSLPTEPPHQLSFQEPYQQPCSFTSPIEISPHGPYNPCEEVNPVEEESSIFQEMCKLMQRLQSELSELNGRLQSLEHNATLVAEEVLPAEVITHYPRQVVYVEEESSEEENDFHTTSRVPVPPAQRSALDPYHAEWLVSAFDHLHSDLPDEEFDYVFKRPELTEACDNGEPVEYVVEQLEGGQVMVIEASDNEDSETEIVYEEPMPKEEVHIPCIIPSMAKVLSEPLDPMSDLFAEFPELHELDSQSGLPCTDCVGDSLCSACAEIEEAIQGRPVDLGVSLACPTQLNCDHSELEVGEANTPWDHGSTTEGISSTEEVLRVDLPKEEKLMDRLLVPITYRFPSLVPSLPLLTWRMPSIDPPTPQHVPFMGSYEFAYLKNDAQLKDLCVWSTEDLIEANEDQAYKKPLCGSSRSPSLGVQFLWNVRTKRRPRDRRHAWKFPRHGSQKLHGFKGHDMIYIVWDPGGQRPSKPWWELQDQFKHKPP